jgi:hypothetical protein
MKFNYIYGKQAEQYDYLYIAKAFMKEEPIKTMTASAKIMYAVFMEKQQKLLETVLSENEEITIAGDVYPKNLVRSKFLKLNYSHVEYVIACLGKNTTKVRNTRAIFLQVCLMPEAR